MKRNYLTVLFALMGLCVFPQFNPDAPWMKTLDVEARRASSNPVTFQEIVDAFNVYWQDRDPNGKGSGFKPFKRWENYWKNFVKEDGTLPTSRELWEVWQLAEQQTQASNLTDLSAWFPVGPYQLTNTGSWSIGQGRVNAIAVDPNNPNIYYAGAPAGGIWKSLDMGTTWMPLSDFLPQIGVSGIAIDYSNSDTVYMATGDDDASDTYSVGVMKSVDGGLTWQNTGLNPNNSPSSMNDIYIHPTNSNILWVATNSGVYKTTDAGVSWTNTLSGNIKDIKLNPANPDTIYAVTPNSFYKSTDGGNTFSQVVFGVPTGSSRLVIDVTPANPSVVYLLSAESDYSFKGLYKSTDSGSSFFTVSTVASVGDIFESSQAWFDMALAVSDANEDEVYVGVLNIWKTTNSGSTFVKMNNWSSPLSPSYTHADIHLLRFFNGQLFAGTDGGFYKSTNGGSNFTDLTQGMQIGQFYKIAVAKDTSSKMVGGLQDNGGQGLNNNVWQNYYGADGMDTAIDPYNSNLYYGFIQFGSSLYISTTSGGSNNGQVSSPNGEQGNWVTPLVMNSESELYSGFSSLYKLCGASWEAVSPSFGTNIDVLEIDDLNPDIIYVGTNATLRKSIDRGMTFTAVETFSSNITSIEVNNNDSAIVYVTTSGIMGGVHKSTDQGLNFTNISNGLPPVTKNVIKHQNLHADNPLFLGTSLGVYKYDDISQVWEPFNNNLPVVSITDLEVNTADGALVAATYGRGIWKTNLQAQPPTDEVSAVSIQGVDSSLGCGDIDSFQVEIKNDGSNTLTTATINHTINGTMQTSSWSGNLLPGATTLVHINRNIEGSGDLKTIKIEVSSPGDTYASNNFITKRFHNTQSGVVNQTNSFESESDALVVYDGFNLSCGGYWERGVPAGAVLNSAHTGTMVYGTNLLGDHDNNVKSYLVSGCYDLTTISNPVLRFYMHYELEYDWDIVYVEYSTDAGASWNVLGSSFDFNWYNSDTIAGENNTCYNCPGAQWTGTNFGMQEYSYNLSAFTNQSSFMVRFVFHSDQAVVEEGVIIDDFVIEGTLGTGEITRDSFHIYPNPSEGVFTIAVDRQEPMLYNLYDVTGKNILNQVPLNTNNLKYTLDLSNYQTGVYFIQIQSVNGTITKKLILD